MVNSSEKVFLHAAILLLSFILATPAFVLAQQRPQPQSPPGSSSARDLQRMFRLRGGAVRADFQHVIPLIERDFGDALG